MSYTILLSSVFTLFTSFWCCVRTDFPSPDDSKLRILSAKLNIIFWLLIFPEGVFYWAIRQWIDAGEVKRSILSSRRRCGWTRRHALFLLMGGFILCNNEGRPVKTLSLRHFELVAVDYNLVDFPLLTSFEIQERSNLHPVFALLAFWQGTWFLARCLYRLSNSSPTSQGFPVITQLEAITAVLIFVSWSIYVFAWEKPLDPQFPILMKPRYRIRRSHNIGYQSTSDLQLEESQSQMTERKFQYERPQLASASRSIPRPTPRPIVSLTIWLYQSIFKGLTPLSPSNYYNYILEFPDGTLKIPLFHVENRAFSLTSVLAAAMLSLGTSIVSFLFILRPDSASFYFPSPVVHLIWRIASIITTSMSAFVLFLLVLIQFFDSLPRIFPCIQCLYNICSAIFYFTTIGGLPPFLLARVTLLVTSLVCLKSIPGDAFVAQRSWVDYIPHF